MNYAGLAGYGDTLPGVRDAGTGRAGRAAAEVKLCSYVVF
jgi:hypothetical protein